MRNKKLLTLVTKFSPAMSNLLPLLRPFPFTPHFCIILLGARSKSRASMTSIAS